MKYEGNNGVKYVIYCTYWERDRWKIEPYPFTGTVWQVSGDYVEDFIKKHNLKEIES